MKLQRIIHHLEDGRRKYVTHNGEMEKWTEVEIENLRRNTEQYGPAAYTADFAKYGIIRIVGFETEDHDLPLNPEIIF